MDRLRPLPLREWPPTMREAMAAMTPPEPTHPQPSTENRPKALNLLGVFAHHPALTRAFFTFNGHVIMGTSLSERQRELLVLRVSARNGSRYEWAQHAIIGRDVGLGDAEIARIPAGPDAAGWNDEDTLLLRAVDELLADGALDEATQVALRRHLDERQVLDLIFTVGAYTIIAWVLGSCEVPLDDDLLALLPPGLDLAPHPDRPS